MVVVRWWSFISAADIVVVRLVKFLWRGTVGILCAVLVWAGLEVGRVLCWVRRPIRILVGVVGIIL